MLHRMIPALAVVLALTACGKDGGATTVHQYEGSVTFSIAIPSVFEVVPEQDDIGGGGGWKNIKFLSHGSESSDILISWQPSWDFDTLLAWFNDIATQQGEVQMVEKLDLPDGRGYYIHYFRNDVEYAKAVVRCGSTALQCMATIARDDPAKHINQTVDACKTLVCK
jgi:hypothetical protein